jgi:hypothetical protein
LAQAHHYSRDLNCSVWDFAIEISCLTELGATRCDLRWMAMKGYVEHAQEVARNGSDKRAFGPTGGLMFDESTCFALTAAGIELAESLSQNRHARPSGSTQPPSSVRRGRSSDEHGPYWDGDRHEFRMGDHLIVKRFKLPSPNQETILMAFDEEGWPPRIDDPLPLIQDCDPKQRLRDTIKSLNRHQREYTVHFKDDGTGQGVLWEPIDRTDGAGSNWGGSGDETDLTTPDDDNRNPCCP